MSEEYKHVRQEHREAGESKQTREVECKLPWNSLVMKCRGFKKEHCEVNAELVHALRNTGSLLLNGIESSTRGSSTTGSSTLGASTLAGVTTTAARAVRLPVAAVGDEMGSLPHGYKKEDGVYEIGIGLHIWSLLARQQESSPTRALWESPCEHNIPRKKDTQSMLTRWLSVALREEQQSGLYEDRKRYKNQKASSASSALRCKFNQVGMMRKCDEQSRVNMAIRYLVR
ncbi:hypothetical protein KCU74_g49, partial [Aureobasidium melanogenum]